MKYKVIKVDLFRGWYVADEFETTSLTSIKGERLTKAEWEDYDDEADTIPFEYDEVIIDSDDDSLVYFLKKFTKD
jgi:hypothetical protein